MTPDQQKAADAIAKDMSEFMFHLTMAYKGHERFVAEMLTNSLCAYTAIAAKDPRAALRQTARAILKFNFSQIRAAHFGYKTLGMKPEQLNNGVIHDSAGPRLAGLPGSEVRRSLGNEPDCPDVEKAECQAKDSGNPVVQGEVRGIELAPLWTMPQEPEPA